MARSRAMHLLRPAVSPARVAALAECLRLVGLHGITDAELVEQPAYRFTRAPSYTHDPRYQVDPSVPFVGEFTAEWRKKRGKRA